MNIRKQMTYCFGIAALAMVSLAGCAERGPIRLHISYLQPEERHVAATKVVVGLSLFKDDRGKPLSVLGKSTYESGVENDLVVQGTVSELVRARSKEAFTARGVVVKDASWDMKSEDIHRNGADLLIGGEIKALSVDSISKPFKTTIKAVVQMKVVVADTAEKKIVRTLDVSSKLESEMWPYSPQKIENILSEALSAAIDQIFKDDDLKKRLP